ncbi:MAG TPA: PP0621 family protein [Burkholderiales bacterium]|nr:PP0621 family protein [Burkholderiales bacterium]
MVKLLLLFFIGFVVYYLIRGYVRSLSKKDDADRIKAPEDMVRCSHCGTHLPRSESVTSNQKIYCCDEHRRAANIEK